MKVSPAIRLFLYAVSSFVFFLSYSASPVVAALSSCTVSVSPSSVTPSSSSTYTFSVGNGGSAEAVWVQITRPGSNFTITGYTAGSWSVSQNDVTATFSSGGSVPSGGSQNLYLTVQAGSSEASSANWTVKMSDVSGGASPTTCTGSLGTAISSTTPDSTAPSISDIVISDVTSSSVKISWTTDESSSTVVEYGTSNSYGSTTNGDGSVTSHNVTISGLSANTTYHYNVKSTDGSSNTGESGDNVFVTAKSGSTSTTQTGTTTITTIKSTPTPVPDRTPPRVVFTTKLDASYLQAPILEGKATDPSGVRSVEYTTDGGRNWLPVDEVDTPNKSSTTFSFTPVGLEDGNYDVNVRATDTNGNTGGNSAAVILVIDRLPPLIGASIVTVESQVVEPINGIWTLLRGLSYTLTFSAVGGPTKVEVNVNGNVKEARKNPDNGLWSTSISFDTTGDYALSVDAIDGAKNETTRSIGSVTVIENGTVVASGVGVRDARISVYYLDTITRTFRLWDGLGYGQENPQKTDELGRYRILLPPGMYYIEVSAYGYKPVVTSIFTVDQNSPITHRFSLVKRMGVQIGPWFLAIPGFLQDTVALEIAKSIDLTNDLKHFPQIGSEFPYREFIYGDSRITTNTFRGKPTVLTFFNTWAPQTPTQLHYLQSLAHKKEINVYGIIPEEAESYVSIFSKRGKYAIPILADPDGELIEPLGITTTPTHVILNRKGIITAIKTGLLTTDELLDTLIQ